MEYVAIIERGRDCSFSADVPDLPGCVSCGDSLDEIKQLIQEAVVLHVASLRERGELIPEPAVCTTTVRLGRPLDGWIGGLSDADAAQMTRVIDDAFGRVRPNEWNE